MFCYSSYRWVFRHLLKSECKSNFRWRVHYVLAFWILKGIDGGNNKFFYGTVLRINGMDYFVPISSKSHNKQDDMPIKSKDKIKKEHATLRFAYMIPVPHCCLNMLNISEINDYTRKERIRKELAFCRKRKDKIEKQAASTYQRIISKVSIELLHNSCDFKLLEDAYIQYSRENNLI